MRMHIYRGPAGMRWLYWESPLVRWFGFGNHLPLNAATLWEKHWQETRRRLRLLWAGGPRAMWRGRLP